MGLITTDIRDDNYRALLIAILHNDLIGSDRAMRLMGLGSPKLREEK